MLIVSVYRESAPDYRVPLLQKLTKYTGGLLMTSGELVSLISEKNSPVGM